MNAVVQNTAVFKPLTNRSADSTSGAFALPADRFVQLVPKGEAPNVLEEGKSTKRIIQVVDEEALGQIMSKLLNRGGEMLIDDEHHSHDLDKSTDANGWQHLNKESLQVRDDGLYGDPRWSSLGMDKLTGGVKRFVSPEFPPSSLIHLGGNRYRVTELSGLALTNRPVFKRLQKPLTNRDANDGIDTATTHTMHKALLAGLLGITDSALDQLDEPILKNRLQGIKDKAAQADTLATEVTTLKNRDAESFITQHDKVIPKDDSLRKHLRETFLANREMAESLVKGFAAAKPDDGLTNEQRARAGKKPLFNRENAEPPAGDAALLNRERERAARIQNRATDIANKESISWGEAWRRAEAAEPAA